MKSHPGMLFCALALWSSVWCFASGLGVGTASAQTTGWLDTGLPDVYLELVGPVSVAGRAQIDMQTLPTGEYRLRGSGPGFVAGRGRFEIDERGFRPRSWAGPTSLFKPAGFEHLENGETRGWYLLTAASASGALWWQSRRSIEDARERIALAYDALAAADGEPVLSAAALDDLANAEDEEFDHSNIKNLWKAYFLSVWIGAGVEAWLLTPEPLFSPTSRGQRVTLPRADRWAAAFRSTLVPGAGQRALGRETRAGVFSVIVLGSAAGAIAAQDIYLDARREEARLRRLVAQESDPELAAPLRNELQDAASSTDARAILRWVVTGVAGYLYAWNIVDAFNIGSHEESRGPSLALSPTREGVALSLSWGFR